MNWGKIEKTLWDRKMMSKTTLFTLFYIFLLLYFCDIHSNSSFQAGHLSQEFVDPGFLKESVTLWRIFELFSRSVRTLGS